MTKILRFDNSKEFIEFINKRADHSPDIIVGLGADCFSFFSCGSWISGYFYKNGKFYDHFTIYKNPTQAHGRLGGIETCESIIKQIRKVTDVYYYTKRK